MNTLQRTTTTFVSVTLLAIATACSGASTPSSPAAPPAKTRTTIADRDRPESSLQRGFAASLVQEIMGKPESVKPHAAPVGKAEVWTYTRRIPGPVVRLQTSAKPAMTTYTDIHDRVVRLDIFGDEYSYRTVQQVTIETVELLMFNNHFLELKITRESKREFY